MDVSINTSRIHYASSSKKKSYSKKKRTPRQDSLSKISTIQKLSFIELPEIKDRKKRIQLRY